MEVTVDTFAWESPKTPSMGVSESRGNFTVYSIRESDQPGLENWANRWTNTKWAVIALMVAAWVRQLNAVRHQSIAGPFEPGASLANSGGHMKEARQVHCQWQPEIEPFLNLFLPRGKREPWLLTILAHYGLCGTGSIAKGGPCKCPHCTLCGESSVHRATSPCNGILLLGTRTREDKTPSLIQSLAYLSSVSCCNDPANALLTSVCIASTTIRRTNFPTLSTISSERPGFLTGLGGLKERGNLLVFTYVTPPARVLASRSPNPRSPVTGLSRFSITLFAFSSGYGLGYSVNAVLSSVAAGHGLGQFLRDHLSEYDHPQFDMTMTFLIPHTSSKLFWRILFSLVIPLQIDLVVIPRTLYVMATVEKTKLETLYAERNGQRRDHMATHTSSLGSFASRLHWHRVPSITRTSFLGDCAALVLLAQNKQRRSVWIYCLPFLASIINVNQKKLLLIHFDYGSKEWDHGRSRRSKLALAIGHLAFDFLVEPRISLVDKFPS
ncbi:hypothetical protein BJV74DRAFT_925367 [Russula compacta]|nr:hypothetical protein BJV74DRAFT_925367 [Russula compacta]